jgi:hypothetical protein
MIYMLDASKRVIELFDNDEFEIFIVNGKNGYGKTTYANRIIAEVYSQRDTEKWGGNGTKANWNIKLFRHHLGFHPAHVVKRWMKMKTRDYVFHWDDAGTWLNALDYQDKFVKSVGKYLQTARTDWACIIFSAIDKMDIVNKIRNFKSCIIIDITKTGSNPKSSIPFDRNRRTATAYHYWHDRHNKEGTENDWEEYFNSWVPGGYEKNRKGTVLQKKGFYGWYKPLRDKYSRMNKKKTWVELTKDQNILESKEWVNI